MLIIRMTDLYTTDFAFWADPVPVDQEAARGAGAAKRGRQATQAARGRQRPPGPPSGPPEDLFYLRSGQRGVSGEKYPPILKPRNA